MKKVILTGASGFVGRHTIPYLLKNDYEVHALFCNHPPALKQQGHLIWHKCDLLDLSAHEKLCADIKASHLLHLAWYSVPGKYWSSLENLRWVQASLELIMNFVKNGGRRAVVAGTCAEYDWHYGYCSEKVTLLNPATLYGSCKNGLADIIKHFSQETGLSYAWGRIFYLYGPYENPDRFIPSLIRTLQKKEVMRCTHGNQIRDFLYVEDVASAFVLLLNSDVNGPINISSGRPVTLKEVAFIAADYLEARQRVLFGALPVSGNESPLVVGDNRRLTQEVGWQPGYDLRAGIEQTVRYWQEREVS